MKPIRLTLLAATLGMLASVARADPGYYVLVPYDNEGLRSVEFRYWTVKPEGGVEVVWPEIGFGYGVTSRWTSTLFLSYIGSSQMPMTLSSTNWQNTVLLTQGQYPFDLAVDLHLIRDRSRPGQRALEFGPLLQTDIGRTRLNANLIFERQWGAAPNRPTQLKYQWQIRHRWIPQLHVGAEGFGELGPWDNWNSSTRQSHRAGPALFTTLRLGEREAIKAQAAFLVGKTYTRPGHMFTLRANYEF